MKNIYSFLIAALTLSSSAYAQSPAQNLMPDGSHDMYLGLGVMSRPLYEGAAGTKRVVIPVMQMQWSNGFFLAGMSAGWHLSNQLTHEFGPMISLELNRTSSGIINSIQTPNGFPGTSNGCVTCDIGLVDLTGSHSDRLELTSNKINADKIRSRLLYGGFYNYQLTNNLRQTNTLQIGAGNDQEGIRLSSDLRYQIKHILPHHHFTLGLGVTAINRAYAKSYFGTNKHVLNVVSFDSHNLANAQPVYVFNSDGSTSPSYVIADVIKPNINDNTAAINQLTSNNNVHKAFSPRAGIKDVHVDLFWNWSLSSSWLVTSKISLSQIVGNNRMSPLVERKTNMTVSSAIAYRF